MTGHDAISRWREGTQMSDDEAAHLERTLADDDLDGRVRLIGYYQRREPDHTRHVLWLIEHAPGIP